MTRIRIGQFWPRGAEYDMLIGESDIDYDIMDNKNNAQKSYRDQNLFAKYLYDEGEGSGNGKGGEYA